MAALADAAGGRWLGHPPDDAHATGVSIDTRTLKPGEVYVAIRGERFDGHDFVPRAFEAGAAAAIVERETDAAGPTLLVHDAVAALQQLASVWRAVVDHGGCRVIAVGGSNGKTTTRHLIHTVLSRGGLTGTQSPKSFNNHLGVPLTLLSARPEHDFVVVEVGTNHAGEVAALAAIVRPDAAVVTAIGREHLEHFGSLEAVAREELSLLDFVKDGGPRWTPRDPPPPFDGVVNLPGEHQRGNAALAAAIGRWMGVRESDIELALAEVQPLPGRGVVHVFPGAVGLAVIDDTYNANPDSMLAALSVLRDLDARRRVAVLGDMFELGDHAAPGHDEVTRAAVDVADDVTLVGDAFAAAATRLGLAARVLPALDASDLTSIVDTWRDGDVVLVKGSRGMRMERVIAAYTDRRAAAATAREAGRRR